MDAQIASLKAFADKNRLRLLLALSEYEELCACQLTELIGVAGATSSRHLSQLAHAGLVENEKRGRWVYYRLTEQGRAHPVLLWSQMELGDSLLFKEDQMRLKQIVCESPEYLCRKQRGEACCPVKE